MEEIKMKKTINEFINEVNEKVPGYKVLSTVYLTNKDKLTFQCPNGHIFKRGAKDFLRYKTCPLCTKKKKKTTDEFKEEVFNLTNGEYEVLGEYKTTHTKILMKHNSNICNYNEYEVSPTNFIQGKRCPICSFKQMGIKLRELRKNQSNTRSKGEKELSEFIKSFYHGEIIENDTNVLNKRQELDVYIPDLNIAFEYNGLCWHSEEGSNGKCDRNYHKNKQLECKQKGIQLIYIYENDWKYRNDIMKSKIKHILKCNDNEKIYARKCHIKEISKTEKNEFLDKNHIQGADPITGILLGLFNEDNLLVAVMTFNKSKNKIEGEYELSRFATNINYRIIGGFSKLLKYFINNYECNQIISYADNRWSTGNVYERNGFIIDSISPTSYYYYKLKNKELEHKFNYRKNKIKKKFPDIYDENKTEKEMMREAGYYRIWDCGLTKYILKINKGDI
jgi:hypothetical protein